MHGSVDGLGEDGSSRADLKLLSRTLEGTSSRLPVLRRAPGTPQGDGVRAGAPARRISPCSGSLRVWRKPYARSKPFTGCSTACDMRGGIYQLKGQADDGH